MNNEIDNVPPQQPVQLPGRIGQATAVEQSRAVAEVHAAIVVAQDRPRDIAVAEAQMHQSCLRKGLAERAFYRFPRAGGAVSGPSVHLARELARCWGNIQYGVNELRRDDGEGQSEMQAWAWDVETNARSSQTFIVPHKRDKSGGPVKLVDLRDIYENNANNGARRLREAIFSVLPPWFVEDAKELCQQTLEGEADREKLLKRIEEAVTAFGRGGITAAQLEAKIGRPRDAWEAADVAQLEVIFRSLKRGEVTKEQEFPAAEQSSRVSADDLVGGQPAPEQPAPQPEAPAEDPWEQRAEGSAQ